MKARIVWLILCAIWGSTWLFIKVGLKDLPPISFAGIRFVIAFSILLAIIVLRKLALPKTRRDWLLLAGTGILAFSINYSCVFWGEQHISAGLASLLQAMIPVFGLVLAHFHLPTERMTGLKIGGVVLGLFGVAVVFSNQLGAEGPFAFWGSAAVVVGAFSAAYCNVLVKSHGRSLDPAILAGGQMFFGLLPLLAAGFLFEGNPANFRWTGRAIGSVLYLAVVGTVLAFLLYYWLVKHMDVTTTMLIALVTPFVAVSLDRAILGELLSGRVLAGGACILAGTGLIVFRKPGVRTPLPVGEESKTPPTSVPQTPVPESQG